MTIFIESRAKHFAVGGVACVGDLPAGDHNPFASFEWMNRSRYHGHPIPGKLHASLVEDVPVTPYQHAIEGAMSC